MANTREELQTLLETILGSDQVYYQPPQSIRMSYPAIIYELADIKSIHAENLPYIVTRKYSVKLVTRDPDSAVVGVLSRLPKTRFDRHFVSDNLNHFVFNIYS